MISDGPGMGYRWQAWSGVSFVHMDESPRKSNLLMFQRHLAEMTVVIAGPCIMTFTASQIWQGYAAGENTNISHTQDIVTFHLLHAVMLGVALCGLTERCDSSTPFATVQAIRKSCRKMMAVILQACSSAALPFLAAMHPLVSTGPLNGN